MGVVVRLEPEMIILVFESIHLERGTVANTDIEGDSGDGRISR